MIPEKRMGVILSVNGDQRGVLSSLARGLFALLLGENIQDVVPFISCSGKVKITCWEISRLSWRVSIRRWYFIFEVSFASASKTREITSCSR